ncbi:PucR family transcriptional regulator [Kineococcus rubinsiae]|uniref:PucR family transcriptional regulator n=1 Tax=Kineococcus rubinsiae TaxID=2609562 RepID=UPI00142FCFFB|nr:PucR family transcriptional regulator [Kineococcus rubinsiae]
MPDIDGDRDVSGAGDDGVARGEAEDTDAAVRPPRHEGLDLQELCRRVEGVGVRIETLVPQRGPTPIRWAHPTELPTPGRYLRGGELVLTVGTQLDSPAACRAFVGDLLDAGAAALGFGVGDVHRDVPEGVLEACVVRGLPLLSVPYGLPFQVVTEALAEHRAGLRVADAQRGSHLVTTVLDVMTQRGLDHVLPALAEHLGGRLLVTGPGGVVEGAAGGPPPTTAGARSLAVTLPGDPPGQLQWYPPEGTSPPRDQLDALVHSLSLWRRERSDALQRSWSELGTLVHLVLDGLASPEALRLRLGLAPAASYAAIALAGATEVAVVSRLPAHAVARCAEALVLFTDDPETLLGTAGGYGLTCGAGSTTAAPQIARSLREALAAFEFAHRRGTTVLARDLATVDALLQALPRHRLQVFVDQLLTPLHDHDRRAGGDLVHSLQALMAGDGSISGTARRLFVHPNTLRHRLRRIAEITGRDPSLLSDRTAFLIAFTVAGHGSGRRPGEQVPAVAPRRRGPG